MKYFPKLQDNFAKYPPRSMTVLVMTKFPIWKNKGEDNIDPLNVQDGTKKINDKMAVKDYQKQNWI